jgi:hypothetical protein
VAPPFFISALDAGEWLLSRPCTQCHWVGGYVVPKARLPLSEIEPSPSLYRPSYSDSRLMLFREIVSV